MDINSIAKIANKLSEDSSEVEVQECWDLIKANILSGDKKLVNRLTKLVLGYDREVKLSLFHQLNHYDTFEDLVRVCPRIALEFSSGKPEHAMEILKHHPIRTLNDDENSWKLLESISRILRCDDNSILLIKDLRYIVRNIKEDGCRIGKACNKALLEYQRLFISHAARNVHSIPWLMKLLDEAYSKLNKDLIDKAFSNHVGRITLFGLIEVLKIEDAEHLKLFKRLLAKLRTFGEPLASIMRDLKFDIFCNLLSRKRKLYKLYNLAPWVLVRLMDAKVKDYGPYREVVMLTTSNIVRDEEYLFDYLNKIDEVSELLNLNREEI